MEIYFSATLRKTHEIEADNRDQLVEKIAAYYSEEAEPSDECNKYYAPEASQVIRHHSDGDGDGETIMSLQWMTEFNKDLERRFHEMIQEGIDEAAHRREISSIEATGRI